VMQGGMGDLDMWHGRTPPPSHIKMNPAIYLEETFRVAAYVAEMGLPLLFDTSRVDNHPTTKILHAGFLRHLLDSIIASANQPGNNDFFRLYHACVAFYVSLVKAGVILPRQYNPAVFDGGYMMSKCMPSIWQVDLEEFEGVLGLGNPLVSSGDGVDVLHEFDKDDSFTLATSQGITESNPDGRFRSFVFRVEGEWANAAPTFEQLVDVMQDFGIDISHLDIPADVRCSYATNVTFRNSAFRDFVRYGGDHSKGLGPHLFVDDDNFPPENDADPGSASIEPVDV